MFYSTKWGIRDNCQVLLARLNAPCRARISVEKRVALVVYLVAVARSGWDRAQGAKKNCKNCWNNAEPSACVVIWSGHPCSIRKNIAQQCAGSGWDRAQGGKKDCEIQSLKQCTTLSMCRHGRGVQGERCHDISYQLPGSNYSCVVYKLTQQILTVIIISLYAIIWRLLTCMQFNVIETAPAVISCYFLMLPSSHVVMLL